MAIQLGDNSTGTRYPVLSQRRIGEEFVGGVIKFERRERHTKDGETIYNKKTGKPRYELVVHLLTLRGDMQAGLAGEYTTPERGEVVRAILKGGAFGNWIEAQNALPRGLQVGDMVYMNTDKAVRYVETDPKAALTTQAEVDEYKKTPAWTERKETLSWQGEVKIREPKPDEVGFVAECEAKYHELGRQNIPLNDDPFPASNGSGGGQGVSDLF